MSNSTGKFNNWHIWTGAALLLVGVAVLVWAYDAYESLPNYLRLASLIPFALAFPTFFIEDYAQWKHLTTQEQLRLFRLAMPPVLLITGSLLWLVFAPSTKG